MQAAEGELQMHNAPGADHNLVPVVVGDLGHRAGAVRHGAGGGRVHRRQHRQRVHHQGEHHVAKGVLSHLDDRLLLDSSTHTHHHLSDHRKAADTRRSSPDVVDHHQHHLGLGAHRLF